MLIFQYVMLRTTGHHKNMRKLNIIHPVRGAWARVWGRSLVKNRTLDHLSPTGSQTASPRATKLVQPVRQWMRRVADVIIWFM